MRAYIYPASIYPASCANREERKKLFPKLGSRPLNKDQTKKLDFHIQKVLNQLSQEQKKWVEIAERRRQGDPDDMRKDLQYTWEPEGCYIEPFNPQVCTCFLI